MGHAPEEVGDLYSKLRDDVAFRQEWAERVSLGFSVGTLGTQKPKALARKIAETEVCISVITLIELAHGAARADTAERKAKRQKFIEELLTAIPIHPVTVPLALRAGRIDGENQARGVRVPLSICSSG